MSQPAVSVVESFVLRLKPHDDIRQFLIGFAKSENIAAACIVSAVGSVEKFHLRFANQKEGTWRSGHFEVVSLSGTFSATTCHLHISISDELGRTTGGHLLDGTLVYTTLELVVGNLKDIVFSREKDPAYGYDELVVKAKLKS